MKPLKYVFKAKAKENKRKAGELYGEQHPKQEVLENSTKPLEQEPIAPLDTRKELANMPVGRNWDNSDNCLNKISQEDASQALNISSKSIERANKVIESGTPELVKAVDDGKEQIAGLI